MLLFPPRLVTSFVACVCVVGVVVNALDDTQIGSGNGGNNLINKPGVGRNNNNVVQHHNNIPDTHHYDVRVLDDNSYPVFRYFPWKHLKDEQLLSAEALGYTEETWNNVGTAKVESKTFDQLNKREIRAIQQLGFHPTTTTTVVTNSNNEGTGSDSSTTIDDEDEGDGSSYTSNNLGDIWDCYSNHYSKYTWDELGEAKVQYYFRLLGFTEANWIYDENDEDSSSSSGLISWEMKWSTLNAVEMNAAKQLCYQQETWDNINLKDWHCTHDHYNDLLWSELDDIGVQDYLVTLGFTEDTWCGGTNEDLPFDWTTKLWEDLSLDEKNAALHLCYYKDSWNGPQLTQYPVFRFRTWSTLAANMQLVAERDLNYSEEKWNLVGSAAIEHKSFESLNDQQQQAVYTLEMTEDSWNCWMNHYSGFSWFELENRFSVQTNFMKLGWTEEDWETKDKGVPTNVPTVNTFWKDLTNEEKDAALDLCFVPQNWDMLSLESWHCNQYNCYCHYDNYYWDELEEEGVKSYFETLGWSKYNWDGWNDNNNNDDYYSTNSGNDGSKATSQVPDTYLLWWEDLTDDQRHAATKVCYTMEGWDHHVKDYTDKSNAVGIFVGLLITLILLGLGGFVGWRLFYKTKLTTTTSDGGGNSSNNNNNDDDVVETQPNEKGELA